MNAKERASKVHDWKVACCIGDTDKMKEIEKELKNNPIEAQPETQKPPIVEIIKPEQPAKIQSNFNYPDGEFTVKQLVESSKMSQPIVSKMVNNDLTSGKLTIVRNESSGRGRPTRILKLK